jgi:tetratricopeptide (TPR) repeat protein/predicted Ser/Thr protein kinase
MSIQCPKCHHENPDDTIYCGRCGTPLKSPPDLSVTKTLLTQVEDLAPGTLFAGRYKILEELGRGGMGRVYKAYDREINENVAIKLLNAEIARDEKLIQRFRNELKIARSVSHKHVCRMYDIGKEDEKYFITMEYVPGKDLKSLLREKGKIAEAEVLTIAKEICEGLAGAHELGIVHRDLKPQNIMMDKEGRAKIMDFGIARSVEGPGVTEAGMIIGTPDYISPEQAEGEAADHRSDIYSLGVILYEMTTGSLPFEGDTAFSVALKHKSQLPPDPKKRSPEISESLSRLILICIEKDRERRYQTAEALLNDLQNIEHGLSLGTKLRPRRASFIQTLVRKRLLVPASLLVIAAIAAGAYFVFGNREPGLDPKKIVVAFFENRTGDPARDTLGQWTADAISQGLDQTGLVEIVPSMLVEEIYMSHKGETPLRFLAQQAKAGTVVSGSYYLQGDTIQLHAEVTDVRRDKLLKRLDPVSGPADEPLGLIEPLQRQLMTIFAVLLEPQLKDYAEIMPAPASYEAYKEFVEGFRLSYQQGKGKLALEHALKALEIDPEWFQARGFAALLYTRMGEYEKADALIKELDERKDKLTPFDLYLLDFIKASLRGDFYGMYHAWVQIDQLLPTPNAEFNVGDLAICINRPREAIDHIAPLDPEAPGVGNYWYDLTTAHHMLGNHKKALKIARRERTLFPDRIDGRVLEIRALAALGKGEEVNTLLEEIRALPRGEQFYALNVTRMAVVLRVSGYREKSLQLLERAIEWFKNRPEDEAKTIIHRWNLAKALYAAEKWEESRRIWEDLHNEEPDDIDILGHLGTLAARRGARAEALRISGLLEKDKGQYPSGWPTFYRANIAALLGEKETAVELLRKVYAEGRPFHIFLYHSEPNVMDHEPLYDYPPYRDFMKPKG